MIAQIDGYYVAAQIRLIQQTHKGAVLLLEGDKDDRVLRRFIDGSCDIEIGFGREQVIKALDLLEEEGIGGVVAVIDADFDRILGRSYDLEGLCVTDCHDLDLTIFSSSALDRVVDMYAEKPLFEQAMGGSADKLRDFLLRASVELACCRLASERHALRLYFKDLKLYEFVDAASLITDLDKLASELVSRSTTRTTINELKTYVQAEKSKQHDLRQLANGHDVATFLGIAFQGMLARRRVQQTWGSEIEAALRLAFDWQALSETELFRCLRAWEAGNKPYRVLRGLAR